MAKPIEKLVTEIRSHVYDAGKAETTCAKHQLQAGWRLLELRKRVEAGEAGDVKWWDYYETQFDGYIKSRKYAEQLMRHAAADDPEAAAEAKREQVRQSHAKAKANGGSRTSKEAFEQAPENPKIGQSNLRNIFLMNCAASRQAARYQGPVDEEIRAAAARTHYPDCPL